MSVLCNIINQYLNIDVDLSTVELEMPIFDDNLEKLPLTELMENRYIPRRWITKHIVNYINSIDPMMINSDFIITVARTILPYMEFSLFTETFKKLSINEKLYNDFLVEAAKNCIMSEDVIKFYDGKYDNLLMSNKTMTSPN